MDRVLLPLQKQGLSVYATMSILLEALEFVLLYVQAYQFYSCFD
jgi:hypothetical protein